MGQRRTDSGRTAGSGQVRRLVVVGVATALLAAACGGDTGADTEEPSASASAPAPTDSATASPSSTGSDLNASEGGGDDVVEAEPMQLQLASFLSETTSQGVAILWWIEELERRTGGNVTVETFWDASLLGAEEVRDGVGDGRVQLGNMTYAYTPSDFPLTSMVEVPFLGDNLGAQAEALNQLYDENDQFQAEWEQQGIKVMSFVGIPPALTGAQEKVDTVDWYNGKTVRASGYFVTALELVGGNPAAIPVTDVYEAMQRGTIDAYGGLILDVIVPTGLYEVGSDIHDPGLGHYANSTLTMELATWESLSPEVQGVIEELNAEFPAKLSEAAIASEDAACEVILDAGGSVSVFPEAETQKWADAIGDAPLNDWIAKAEGVGVEDASSMYDAFVGYYQEAEEGDFAGLESGAARCAALSESDG